MSRSLTSPSYSPIPPSPLFARAAATHRLEAGSEILWAELPSPAESHNRRLSEDSSRLAHITGQCGLRKAVTNIVMDRLEKGGVDTQKIDPILLNHCLPNDSDSISWETIIHTPIRVPDHILSEALNLRIATNRELPGKEDRSVILYVRSFQLTVKQLLDVIAQFNDAGLENATTAAWLDCIEFLKPDESVYIRYVGRTERSALLRHRHDLTFHSIKFAFISKFLHALGRTHPLVIDAVMIYELPGAPLRQLSEGKEQALIALLDLSSLVNQRICEALQWEFTPVESHRRAFIDLGTNSFSYLSSLDFQLMEDYEPISTWAMNIQEYTRTHKLCVCRSGRQVLEFPDALRTAIIRQARPSLFRGKFVLFLTLGAEMSLEAWRNTQGFYSGTSDSAMLMKNYLKRLWGWEKGEPLSDRHLDMLIAAGTLPFINLSPWLKAEGKDFQEAIRFAKAYILLVKPMIILTLGVKPSSSAASAFNHSFGYPASQTFEAKVGQLEVIDCDGVCFIQLPCYHPGKARFCRNPETFSKVFDMTLWVLLSTIKICLDSAKTFEAQPRETWCQHIKTTVGNSLERKGFYRSFKLLKDKLRSEGPKPPSNLAARARANLGIAARAVTDRFLFIGFALGPPLSLQRRQQVRTLWDSNIPELHEHIPRSDRNSWWAWACGLHEGTSFFADASVGTATKLIKAAQGPDVFLQPQISRKRQDRSHKSSHLSVSVRQKKTSEVLMPWNGPLLEMSTRTTSKEAVTLLTATLCDNMRPSQVAEGHKMAQGRIVPQFLRSWNGSEVYAWRNGGFAIYWKNSQGHDITFTLRLPLSNFNPSPAVRKFVFL
ncbi:uncharacterized protein PGRI_058960 [Penicillium griseofulvum]|uniref:Uncharacterized protein n=1 Tax=Penicillium patulum TaxID=5078 RepID=A0A135LLT8_PENPA|nr:uncharacterized protein PGRI_058960 [Penicillium griseofulvum]KXG49928.1 hypothetical protein PGRI_058960 [Penicillium griseofulvum]